MSKKIKLDNLEPNTTYDVVFGMQTGDGLCFWSENYTSFKTLPIYSEVFTIGIEDITSHSVVINGAVVLGANENLISYGFVIRTFDAPDTILYSVNKEEEYFSLMVDGLLPETQYSVCAFAEIDLGIIYGDPIVFSTNSSSYNGIFCNYDDEMVVIYNLEGVEVYRGDKSSVKLVNGVYIVQSGNRIYKIQI